MPKINSSKVKILVGGVAITNLDNVSYSVNGAMIDVTTKDSAGWKEVIPGLKDASMSGDGTVDFSAAYPSSNIFTNIVNGTQCALKFYDGTPTTGITYSASGYFTKYELKGGTEDSFTFSFAITITGIVTQAASV